MARQIPLSCIQAAQASHRKCNVFPSVILAQWVLESAWGTRMSGKNNPFGIKAAAGQAGTVVTTHEQNASGVAHVEQGCFADFASVDDAFDAHGRLLLNKRYLPVRAAKTAKDAAAQLRACGYATDVNYSSKLIGIMDANALYQYDPGGIAANMLSQKSSQNAASNGAAKRDKPAPAKAAAGVVVVAAAVTAAPVYAAGPSWLVWGVLAAGIVGFAAFLALHFRKA